MKKLMTLSKLKKLTGALRKTNQSVGLVVGSFDVVHLGHLNLFRFAKKHVSVLIVGLDSDASIQMTKGEDRPVYTAGTRADFLSDLVTIDHIFILPHATHHGSEEASRAYASILEILQPTHIFTHKTCDRHWQEKKRLANKNHIKFLLDPGKYVTHSGIVISKLLK